jgi:hypothetical protein
MKRWSGLVALALVGACTSSAKPVVSTTEPSIAGGTPESACLFQATALAPSTLNAKIANTTATSGAPITWKVTVVNTSSTEVKMYFLAGAQNDIVLRDGNGTIAYQWSASHTPKDSTRCVTLPPGGQHDFTLQDATFAVPAGTYRATIIMASAPDPLSEPQSIIVTA